MSYPFRRAFYGDVFAFESIGFKTITKLVSFYEEDEAIYSISFCDLDADGNPLPVTASSNNGDAYAVLATVSQIIQYFLTAHPAAAVAIVGADDRRARIYYKLLTRSLKNESRFLVEGIKFDNTTEPLIAGTHYKGYVVFM